MFGKNMWQWVGSYVYFFIVKINVVNENLLQVWTILIHLLAHPKAALYKNKTFPDWVSLAIIFGDGVADGRDGFARNYPEPIETQAEEETQADDMDNVFWS